MARQENPKPIYQGRDTLGMSETTSEQKLAIAHQMVARLDKDEKRPYATLKWLAEVIYDGKHWESYFIAVNILKQRGVENAKRKPLTNLTQKERAEMRKIAKVLAEMMLRKMGVLVKVEKTPIRICEETNEPYLQISCKTSRCCTSFIYPTRSDLQKFAALSDFEKNIRVIRIIEKRFNTYDAILEDRIEVVKADLDLLFDKS
jgi:hypothetical protein